MKLQRNLPVNMKMVFTNYGFYICAVFTIILCMSAAVYYDPIANERCSVIKCIKDFDHDYMMTDVSFCSYKVIENGSGSWLSMFIPIVSAFAFIPLSCDKAESGAIRNIIFRTSKFSFNLSEFLTACFSGGLAVMSGFILFSVIVCLAFPNISEYSSVMQEQLMMQTEMIYPELADKGYIFLIFLKYAEMFLYGFISTAPAVMLTSFVRNKYLVMCIPFFFKYAITQTCIKLSSDTEQSVNMQKITNIIAPDSIVNAFYYPEKYAILIYNLFLVILAFTLYTVIYNRRFDSGA